VKKFVIGVLLIVIVAVFSVYHLPIHSGATQYLGSSVAANSTTKESGNAVDPCDQSLWQHIYHSSRLEVIQKCITVTGVVEDVKPEKDGDEHISLRLDAGQEHLLNTKNYSEHHGDLVLEVICMKNVSQEDAVSACSGYYNNVYIPKRGEKISATGTYVLDHQHGWNEIHPVTQIISNGTGAVSSPDNNPVIGRTKKGQPIYLGPRGGRYHYSSSGNKVYERAR